MDMQPGSHLVGIRKVWLEVIEDCCEPRVRGQDSSAESMCKSQVAPRLRRMRALGSYPLQALYPSRSNHLEENMGTES